MIFLKIAIYILNLIYCLFKLLPIQNKITFISRQSNFKSEDAILLEKEIKKRNNNIKIVFLFKKMENKILYLFHMFKQMYHLATSKVIILDSYCIVASILKKRKGTTIIQMWHALGAFKKFGYSILNQEEGSNKKIAETMKMHNNYDVIFTSSEYTKKFFAEAFNYNINKLMVMPLPRVDLLINNKYKNKIKKQITKTYPALKNKKNILYAPTFRKKENDTENIYNIINSIDYKNYNLIVKLHPLSKLEVNDKRIVVDKNYSTIDMMVVADYIITDYSAIVFEASILEKPIYFYCYDYEKYYKTRNFYINYKKDMPNIISPDPKKIINSIEKNKFDLEKIKQFKEKFINLDNNKSSTEKIVDFIFENLN